MKKIAVRTKTDICPILVGERIENLERVVGERRAVIVLDRALEPSITGRLPNWPIIPLHAGEDAKGLSTVRELYNRFLEFEIDRDCYVVAIGGGALLDTAAFAASTFMRGVPLGLVPTTLLAQVDAGIGGKNGVNFLGFKNLIGVIRQPDFVLCDLTFLNTLPPREISNGFAEVIKHAAIADAELFSILERSAKAALALDPDILELSIFRSLAIKGAMIEQDENERGERRKLNYGHTLGHALEKVLHIPHGEAVSIGMVAAAELSVSKKLIGISDVIRLEALLQAFKLPTRHHGKADEIAAAMAKDKKRSDRLIHSVLLKALGNAVVSDIPLTEWQDFVTHFCKK